MSWSAQAQSFIKLVLQMDTLRPGLSKQELFITISLHVDTLCASLSKHILFTKLVLHMDTLRPGLTKCIFFAKFGPTLTKLIFFIKLVLQVDALDTTLTEFIFTRSGYCPSHSDCSHCLYQIFYQTGLEGARSGPTSISNPIYVGPPPT